MSEKEDFSKDTIEYLSKLALVDLTEEEKEKFVKQLNNIISYFKKLNEIDTSKVEPTTHPIESLKNVFREDIPRKGLTKKEALQNTKSILDGYFKAPRILKE